MEWIHEDVKITITEQGLFCPEEYDTKYHSLREAKAAIEESNKAARTSVDKQLNLAVLNSYGDQVFLRRLHEGTGVWLTEPKDDNGSFYVNHPEVSALLKQVRQLEAQVKQLTSRVSKAQIEYRRGYGRLKAEQIVALTEQMRPAVAAAERKWAEALKTP